MTKLLCNRVTDFVERWTPDNAGRYEFLLNDGQRIIPWDCYLSRDLAYRPDCIWVNHDSPGHPVADNDPLNVVAIIDLEGQCPVIE